MHICNKLVHAVQLSLSYILYGVQDLYLNLRQKTPNKPQQKYLLE